MINSTYHIWNMVLANAHIDIYDLVEFDTDRKIWKEVSSDLYEQEGWIRGVTVLLEDLWDD